MGGLGAGGGGGHCEVHFILLELNVCIDTTTLFDYCHCMMLNEKVYHSSVYWPAFSSIKFYFSVFTSVFTVLKTEIKYDYL